jgi:SMP-30/Gluconolactonase/LRE-like region
MPMRKLGGRLAIRTEIAAAGAGTAVLLLVLALKNDFIRNVAILAFTVEARPVRRYVTTEISGMPGPEDLVVDRSTGRSRLLVSSCDRSNKSFNGEIYEVDPATATPVPRPLQREKGPEVFRPHGIALVNRRSTVPLLYVINHLSDKDKTAHDRIEIFQVERDRLVALPVAFTGAGIAHPNDLDVVFREPGNATIYVTNPMLSGAPFLWEALIGPRGSFVSSIDQETKKTKLVKGFRFPNGIAVSNRLLFVASSAEQRIFRYRLNDDDSIGEPDAVIHIGSAVDNITVDTDGSLLVAAHASEWRFIRHASAGKKGTRPLPFSPTEVWRISDPGGASPGTERIFPDPENRRAISGGSAAVCVDGDLFIGQIFGNFVLRVADACRRGRS